MNAFLDPATSLGTARWVALGVAVYDALRNGVNMANGAVLLILAGVPMAVRYFDRPPTMPPTWPPPGAPA